MQIIFLVILDHWVYYESFQKKEFWTDAEAGGVEELGVGERVDTVKVVKASDLPHRIPVINYWSFQAVLL